MFSLADELNRWGHCAKTKGKSERRAAGRLQQSSKGEGKVVWTSVLAEERVKRGHIDLGEHSVRA